METLPPILLSPPIVDIFGLPEEDAVALLHGAFHDHGFAFIRNRPGKLQCTKDLFSSAANFFVRDASEKSKVAYKSARDNMGWEPPIECFEKSGPVDIKESFNWATNRPTENKWLLDDDEGKLFKKRCEAWSDLAREVELRVYALLNIALGLPKDTLESLHARSTATSNRVLYYPGAASFESKYKDIVRADAMRCGAHTDYGTITIVINDGRRGLQLVDQSLLPEEVRAENKHPSIGCRGAVHPDAIRSVPYLEECSAVFVSEVLENITRGMYKAVVHQVANVEMEQDRYTASYFAHPDDDVDVSQSILLKSSMPEIVKFHQAHERIDVTPISAKERYHSRIGGTHVA
eukprot:GHVN01077084.1.p1 GENE.GHVN01077084.1~~GHVN01077084.1.p1  ORF type:complete len:348 (+),score=33.31 GHVN01077084.1:369-1412(+)